MGETYLVRHVFMGEQLVLKRVRPELAEDAIYQKLFLREAQLLAALRNEEGIVGIRHACQTREGYLILLLEHVQGGNLLQWLEAEREGGLLKVAEAMIIAAELAATLAAAHEHGILNWGSASRGPPRAVGSRDGLADRLEHRRWRMGQGRS